MINHNERPAYYAIIPATVRYDERLKCHEKFMYGEITALSNVNGFCTAGNGYFASLYEVEKRSITRWLSNLQKHNYINIVLIRNEKNQVVRREIYLTPIDNIVHTPHDRNVQTLTTEMSSTNSTSINNTTTTKYKEKANEYELTDNVEFELEFEKFQNFNSNDTNKINMYYWEQWLIQWQRHEAQMMKQMQQQGA